LFITHQMNYKGLTLDKFQEDAINAIHSNKSVVVSAPTGSGKTLIADYIIDRDLKNGKRIIYTAPIKALSNQKYKDFCSDYGEENIGLLTGDTVKNPHAPVLIMTTEVYRNMVLANDEAVEHISYVIFDEIHFINDIERGTVWEESVIFSQPHVRMLCLSATIPNAEEFAAWIEAIKNHEVQVIRHDKRNVPLHVEFYDAELGLTTLKKIKEVADIPDYGYIRGRSRHRRPKILAPSHVDLVKQIRNKTPCLFFCFSRISCQRNAKDLAKKKVFKQNPKISAFVRQKLENSSPEIGNLKSTRLLRQTLPYGIGFHHAGLLPIIKEIVEELFGQGLINVLYTTETFAVGINMPARTTCFENFRKYDGRGFRFLNSKEYFQIAGRAGRRGLDKEGYVFVMINRRDFDYYKINRVVLADTDPIESQFKLSINTVLNLIDQHSKEEIHEILRQSFHAFQKYGKKAPTLSKSHHTFNKMKKQLTNLGYIKDGSLTEKGRFASKIYADEILISEIFATDFYKKLNEQQILLTLACICYEPRERTQFFEKYPTKSMHELRKKLRSHDVLREAEQFKSLTRITALIQPCYEGASIFDIMKNTNLLEGDLIRFFRQILDRIGQIKSATSDHELTKKCDNVQKIVLDCLKDIDVV
jgi:superfamily II RNA helicase